MLCFYSRYGNYLLVDCKGVGLFALKIMGSNLEGMKRDFQDFFLN